MHGVRDGDEGAFALVDLLLRALPGDDQVDPFIFRKVLRDHGGFIGTPRVVADVVDGWVGKIEPHGRVEDIPLAEVAVGDGVVRVANLDADFKIVARVRVDCG